LVTAELSIGFRPTAEPWDEGVVFSLPFTADHSWLSALNFLFSVIGSLFPVFFRSQFAVRSSSFEVAYCPVKK
jgi:hypothetical protein